MQTRLAAPVAKTICRLCLHFLCAAEDFQHIKRLPQNAEIGILRQPS
jgi:hypothetical protein